VSQSQRWGNCSENGYPPLRSPDQFTLFGRPESYVGLAIVTQFISRKLQTDGVNLDILQNADFRRKRLFRSPSPTGGDWLNFQRADRALTFLPGIVAAFNPAHRVFFWHHDAILAESAIAAKSSILATPELISVPLIPITLWITSV